MPILYFLICWFILGALSIRSLDTFHFWILIGGAIFMATAGSYLDGRAPKTIVILLGVFTLAWAGVSYVGRTASWQLLVAVGLVVELIIGFLFREVPGERTG